MHDPMPTLQAIKARHQALSDRILRTPTVPSTSVALARGLDGDISLKLELFQHTNTFKPRGALSVMSQLSETQKAAGITAVSAGNHAIAAAWAAKREGISAKVVMIGTANQLRIDKVRALGADLVISPDAASAFAEVDRLVAEEGRTFVHPFEGPHTTLGAAGVGLELMEDANDLEAVVVSIGGGGLISGVASAVKLMNPKCKVYGVEPVGAPNMRKSLDEGAPATLDRVATIADSLAPPYSLPYSFSVCQTFLDDIVLVDDDQICAGVTLLQEEAKLAVEPAAGAVLAGAMGPLRARLAGQRVGLVICGANIDAASYRAVLERGEAHKDALLTAR